MKPTLTPYEQRTVAVLKRAMNSPRDKRKWNRYFNRVERETNAKAHETFSVRHRKWALKTFSKMLSD